MFNDAKKGLREGSRTPISGHSGISVRLRNILKANGLHTVEDIRSLSRAEIMQIPKMGKKTSEELANLVSATSENTPFNELRSHHALDSLNLSVRARNALKAGGIFTLGQLDSVTETDLFQLPSLGRKTVAEIISAQLKVRLEVDVLEQVNQHNIPDALSKKQSEPFLVRELDLSLDARYGLKKSGVSLVHDLVNPNPTVALNLKKNMDESALMEVESKLTGFGLVFGLRSNSSTKAENSLDADQWNGVYPAELALIRSELFCQQISELVWLKNAGIYNALDALNRMIGDSVDLSLDEFQICNRLRQMLFSLFETPEDFNLERYIAAKQEEGLLIIPSDTKMCKVEYQFDEQIFALIFNSYFEFTGSKREAAVAMSRLWMPGGVQETLEEIGIKFGVSRERIRQLESKVLKSLSSFVLRDGFLLKRGKIRAVLHPSILSRIETLRNRLGSTEEIDLPLLIQHLERSFDLPSGGLSEALPFLICIIQGTTQSHFTKSILRGENGQLVDIKNHLDGVRITDLRLPNKSTEALLRRGLSFASDIDALSLSEGGAVSRAFEKASAVASVRKAKQKSLKEALIEGLGLFEIDQDTLAKTEDFPAEFVKIVGELIAHITSYKYCAEIYHLRTKFSAKRKLTLSECAARLYGFSSNSKIGMVLRSEKQLLERLSITLLQNDFRFARAWIPREIISCIQQCRPIYEANLDDFDGFFDAINREFSGDKVAVENFSSVVWSIFSGAPPNRYYHLSKEARDARELATEKSFTPGQIIKLRGFRQTH